jgi:4'-phosphopantetheinyl transferase
MWRPRRGGRGEVHRPPAYPGVGMLGYWRERLRLSPGCVDVVVCRLDLGPAAVDVLARLLAPDEAERARRLRSETTRRAHVVAHGRLRQLLAAVLDRAPGTVGLTATAGGKPELAGENAERVRFSLAHSGSLMLCALTRDDAVGVDVEEIREDVEVAEIAERFFAAEEARTLLALAPAPRRAAFFACWTRKEAVLKATGDGLARALDSFVVSVQPEAAAVLAAGGNLGHPEEWSLLPVELPPGYAGAAAVRRPGASLRIWAWPDDPP